MVYIQGRSIKSFDRHGCAPFLRKYFLLKKKQKPTIIRTKTMPRPKSEITGSKVNIGLRMTEDQRDMFKALGGIDWLRKYLDRQIRSELIQLGISEGIRNDDKSR